MATRINIEGIVAQDPELRGTSNGTPVTNLRVLDNVGRKGPDGTWQKIATTAYEITVWGYLAEQVVNTITTGDIVKVEARNLITQPWTSRRNPGTLGADIKCTADSVAKMLRAYAPKQQQEEPQPEPQPSEAAPKPQASARKGTARKAKTA